ncbi:EAL domain-containing protein [Frankia sp. Cr2]|uniref:EAL domain-containing protein n=1 Tax=Frankia sp. Cr2 TaxID=3073932 RepID=UPI002AD20306|nr:EAL domain-containing protein [Frankia sp. Cr2]
MILEEIPSTSIPDADRTTGSTGGWSDALRRALADPGQPRVVFQPIVDLRRGVIAGYEALARFGANAAPSPDLWFAAADRAGVAARFEARVLREALAARDRLPPSCFLAVNVMPHLLTTPEVAEVWLDADLSGLVMELNEAVSTEQAPEIIATTQALRARGGVIAMDDVGSGYAGLRQLARIRPELVKLDRDLVAHANVDQVRRTLTELVNVFASRLGALVIAEGVERDEELATLVELGIPFGQGWHLGRPAATWQRLDPAISRRIRLLAQRTARGDGVGSLLEQIPIPHVPHGPDHRRNVAAETSHRVPPASRRLDVASRPRTGGAGAGSCNDRGTGTGVTPAIAANMCARPDEHVAEVARRAMNRTPEHRFDPVVVVTEMGRPIGLVRVERLVLRLAELARPYPDPRTAVGWIPRQPTPRRPMDPLDIAPDVSCDVAASRSTSPPGCADVPFRVR